MINLYVEAPFAVFRTFTAGYFRPTAGFMTHSAAYGLLLNLAGIEMRHDDGMSAMTLIKTGLPKCRIALGTPALPMTQSVYQQLHNYPVGNTGMEEGSTGKKEPPDRAKGGKYNIVPVRRELLTDLKAYILAEVSEEFDQRVVEGLRGAHSGRYGLPFLGDNNFLPSRIELREPPPDTCWWCRMGGDEDGGLRSNVTRLTIRIDRSDMSKSESALFRLGDTPSNVPQEEAWVEVTY